MHGGEGKPPRPRGEQGNLAVILLASPDPPSRAHSIPPAFGLHGPPRPGGACGQLLRTFGGALGHRAASTPQPPPGSEAGAQPLGGVFRRHGLPPFAFGTAEDGSRFLRARGVVAVCSAIKKHSVLPGLLILGDLSIQGNIKSVRSLVEPLQVGMDNGARRALIPLENKRNFLEVSGDIVERVDPVFFSDPMTAAMKALGMT
jgi:hypothetical protein